MRRSECNLEAFFKANLAAMEKELSKGHQASVTRHHILILAKAETRRLRNVERYSLVVTRRIYIRLVPSTSGIVWKRLAEFETYSIMQQSAPVNSQVSGLA